MEGGQTQKRVKSYNCLYQYENNQLKLDYDLLNGIWVMKSNESNLNILFEDLNNNPKFSLNQQIEIIIKRFDHYFDGKYNFGLKFLVYYIYSFCFLELKRIPSMIKEDNQVNKYIHHRSNDSPHIRNISTPSTIPEVDEEQTNPSQSQQTFQDTKTSVSVTSNRIHPDHSYGSINSVRSAQ